MRLLLLISLISIQLACGQHTVSYGTPQKDTPLPNKFEQLPKTIRVMHFPKTNHPVKLKNRYYWKHATAIYTEEKDVKIIEYGAYLFYNGKWNLRKVYPLKALDKTFNTKNQQLLQGQPYVWANNWRTDSKLFGGWALWYFIGKTPNGRTICGYNTLNTTSNLLN